MREENSPHIDTRKEGAKPIYDEWISYDMFTGTVKLYSNGYSDAWLTFKHTDGTTRRLDWYKNERTGEPFIPKRRNFISLVKQMIREGDLNPKP